MVIVIIILLLVVLLFVVTRKNAKKHQEQVNEYGALESMGGFHCEGLPVPKGASSTLFGCPDKLIIETDNGKFEIRNEQIISIGAFDEQEIIDANKSVVGRAIVGGVLLGGLGAIVGGMSGTGTKKKKGKLRNYLVINYKNSSGDITIVSFENNFLNIRQKADNFSKVAGIDKSKTVTL